MSTRRKYIDECRIKTNYTTIFLLPMLGFNKFFYPKEFIAAYVIDDEKPKLALTFDNTDSIELKKCLSILMSHREFVSADFDDDNKEVVIIASVPKYYSIDYNMFKIGRYTKFSNIYKEVLLDVHGRITGNGERIMMVDALFPDRKAKEFKAEKLGVQSSDLPNGEVMSIPDLDKERYVKASELKLAEEKK